MFYIIDYFMSYFKKPKVYNQDHIINNIIYETNLYRKMLGLSCLSFNETLTRSAKLNCEQIIYTNIEIELPKIGLLLLDDRKETFKQNNKESIRANYYITDTYNKSEIGLHVIKAMQLSNITNYNLIHPDYSYVGVAVDIRPNPLEYRVGEIAPLNEKSILYVTQCFMFSQDNQTIELSEIEITEDIESHLERYSQYFCNDLNELLKMYDYFHEGGSEDEITNDDCLEHMASEQLKTSLESEINIEETQRKYKDLILATNKPFCNVESIIIYSLRYLPSCRLVNTSDGLPDEINQRLLDKQFNKFGIKVQLSQDKSFLISIILAKYE
ncbi:hypothetical protein CDIK_2956 [Cucumispora dikerogammari]|nr:hypothetical protein CDIK_2956 [Cucumispora dikerogammari]